MAGLAAQVSRAVGWCGRRRGHHGRRVLQVVLAADPCHAGTGKSRGGTGCWSG